MNNLINTKTYLHQIRAEKILDRLPIALLDEVERIAPEGIIEALLYIGELMKENNVS